MNLLRFVFWFFCGAAIQAGAAMFIKAVFSHGLYPPTTEFFLFCFGASLGLMIVCLLVAMTIERLFRIHRVWSHFITVIVLTALLALFQVWDIARHDTHVTLDLLLMGITVPTLVISSINSLTTFVARHLARLRRSESYAVTADN